MKREDVTIKEIERLAELSTLDFTEQEKKAMIKEVSGIIKMLNECDTIEANDYEFDNTIDLCDLREDEAKESITNELALTNAPKQRKGQFNVPMVVE